MNHTIVKTRHGEVEGFYEDGLFKWFGIPYAAPPVGELRFKRAVECEDWDTPRECRRMADAPIQMAAGRFADFAGTDRAQSEDCLYLNIWSPEGARNAPVMIYIFGGGHHAGDAGMPQYDMSEFAKDGIVGVSFNYRLGVLGFYDFSSLDPAFESNCGMSDIIMAVRWVRDNIDAFGGDPDRITVCGESAGATEVLALLGAPAVKGCFNRAIMMSPLPGNITNDRMQAMNRDKYFKLMEMKPEDVSALRTMEASRLKKGCCDAFTAQDSEYPGILPSGPVIDDLIPHHPIEIMKRGGTKGIKCLFGTCKNEGGLFWYLKMCLMSWEDVDNMLALNGLGHKVRQFHQIYGHLGEKKAVQAVNRDRMFWADTIRAAIAHSAGGGLTYMYRFDYETPITKVLGIGSVHGMDIWPVFGNTEGNGALCYRGDMKRAAYRRLTEQMHKAFVEFMRTGRPGVDGEVWDPFTETIQATMHFCRKTHQTIERLNPEIFELWKDIRLYV